MSAAARGHGLVRFAPPALGVLGAALILLLGTNYGFGVGLSWDSSIYVSAARNLVAGDGLVTWFGGSYPIGPLFPLLLAAAELVGIDAVDAARYLNAAAFGLTVFTVAAWLQRHVRSPLSAVWAGCACALMPALIYAAASVWTEIIFVLCTMVSLALLDRFLSGGKAPALLLAAAAAAAACLNRYIGATLILAGALILLLRNGIGIRARLRDSTLWSAVSLAPIGAWMVRNLVVIGPPLSEMDIGVVPPDDFVGLISLHLATGEFASWLFGPTGFDLLNGALGSVTGIDLAGPATVAAIAAKSVLLAVLALGAGYALARYRPGFLRANRTVLTVAIVYAAAYWLFLVVFVAVNDWVYPVRYLLPLFPPLLVVATLVLDGLLAKRSFTNAAPAKHAGPAAAAVPLAVALVMSLWLAQQAGAAYGAVKTWLNDPGWSESDVIRYLRANRLDGDVWSNEPPALYFATEQRRLGTISQSLAEVTDHLANWQPAKSVYVVLFESAFRNHDYRADDLAALPGVERVADLDDGVILHRRPAISASSAEDRVVRAYFDIHVYEDALAYFREPCTEADVQADFLLRVTPADAVDLSAAARAEGAVFNSLDFSFAERGAIQDGRCLAVVTFDYQIRQFHTGQFRPGHPPFWEVEAAP